MNLKAKKYFYLEDGVCDSIVESERGQQVHLQNTLNLQGEHVNF